MNYLKTILLAALTTFFAMVSCGSSDDKNDVIPSVSVSLSPETINATALAANFVVNVKTDAKEWTAYGSDEWIKVKTDAVASTISVSLTANTGAQRSGSVTFKSGNTRKEIAVTQAAPLTVDPTTLYINSEGGEKTVTVNYTDQWTASASESWLSCKTSGNTLTVTATENAGDNRACIVTVKTIDESVEIAVTQAGAAGPVSPIEGYTLVWQDEFNEGSELSSDWRHEVKGDHWVNNELQNYVNHKSPKGKLVTEIVDGKLRINCFKENGKVYSGRVYAKDRSGWQYGYVEASIKLPSGKGTWPAFWMMPVNFKAWPDDGEIDIMEEVGANPNYVSSSLHAIGHVHSNNTQVTKEVYCKGAEGEFHTYGMEWTAEYFQFYVDGQKTLYYKNPGTGKRDWPYDAPFYVILNLAWGGDWGGYKGIDESALPVTMEVDWVRVWQR